MKRELTILLDELRRLKAEGVGAVNVSDQALDQLRERARGLGGQAERAPQPREKSAAAEEEKSRDQPRREADLKPLPDFNPDPAPAVPAVAARSAKKELPPPPKVTLPEGDKKTQWEALRKQVLECPTCGAHVKPDCHVVFGVGNLDADIFFIGEAPGADEEQKGEPFVGRAGETLTKMIQAMGLDRDEVYIGNIMNWRPEIETGNRPPSKEEMEFCLPYLLAQIDIVQPKVLVALGNTAVSGLFGADPKRKMMDVRGQWKDFHGIPTMITYHPAYLVRNASNAVKRIVWEDLLQVMEKVGLPISEKQRGYFKGKK